jgi:hypothetical protein
MAFKAEKVQRVKQAILDSPDVHNDLSRKFLFWAIDKTEGLTQMVAFDIGPFQQKGFVTDFFHSAHDIKSSGGKTHIDKIMHGHFDTQYIFNYIHDNDGKDEWRIAFSTIKEFGKKKLPVIKVADHIQEIENIELRI